MVVHEYAAHAEGRLGGVLLLEGCHVGPADECGACEHDIDSGSNLRVDFLLLCVKVDRGTFTSSPGAVYAPVGRLALRPRSARQASQR